MDAARAVLARENAALKSALAVAQTRGLEVAAELAVARVKASEDIALIAQQKLRIDEESDHSEGLFIFAGWTLVWKIEEFANERAISLMLGHEAASEGGLDQIQIRRLVRCADLDGLHARLSFGTRLVDGA